LANIALCSAGVSALNALIKTSATASCVDIYIPSFCSKEVYHKATGASIKFSLDGTVPTLSLTLSDVNATIRLI
jgi:hypothetical protein